MKNSKEEQKQHLIDIMRGDEELGLYDEPKQQTIEEFIESEGYPTGSTQEIWKQGVFEGAKWQQKQMYSEEEVYHILVEHTAFLFQGGKSTLTKWFEQFKK